MGLVVLMGFCLFASLISFGVLWLMELRGCGCLRGWYNILISVSMLLLLLWFWVYGVV